MTFTDDFAGSISRLSKKRREWLLCLATHPSFPLKMIEVGEGSQKRHLASHNEMTRRQEDDAVRHGKRGTEGLQDELRRLRGLIGCQPPDCKQENTRYRKMKGGIN
jgi:hypothetical protein